MEDVGSTDFRFTEEMIKAIRKQETLFVGNFQKLWRILMLVHTGKLDSNIRNFIAKDFYLDENTQICKKENCKSLKILNIFSFEGKCNIRYEVIGNEGVEKLVILSHKEIRDAFEQMSKYYGVINEKIETLLIIGLGRNLKDSLFLNIIMNNINILKQSLLSLENYIAAELITYLMITEKKTY